MAFIKGNWSSSDVNEYTEYEFTNEIHLHNKVSLITVALQIFYDQKKQINYSLKIFHLAIITGTEKCYMEISSGVKGCGAN